MFVSFFVLIQICLNGWNFVLHLPPYRSSSQPRCLLVDSNLPIAYVADNPARRRRIARMVMVEIQPSLLWAYSTNRASAILFCKFGFVVLWTRALSTKLPMPHSEAAFGWVVFIPTCRSGFICLSVTFVPRLVIGRNPGSVCIAPSFLSAKRASAKF